MEETARLAANMAKRELSESGQVGRPETKTYFPDEKKEPVELFGNGDLFYHVSEETPDIIGSVIRLKGTDAAQGIVAQTIQANEMLSENGITAWVIVQYDDPGVVVIPDGVEGFPKGLYFLANGILNPISLTVETVHPIDPKYLPGVCLPVVEIASIEVLTEAEQAKLTACIGLPIILKVEGMMAVPLMYSCGGDNSHEFSTKFGENVIVVATNNGISWSIGVL